MKTILKEKNLIESELADQVDICRASLYEVVC